MQLMSNIILAMCACAALGYLAVILLLGLWLAGLCLAERWRNRHGKR